MYKVSVIGHYGAGKQFLDGQTVKTKIITEELKKFYGDNQINCLDTYGKLRTLIRLFFMLPLVMLRSYNIVILPAHNGLKFFALLLPFYNLFIKRTIHYCVIGGWLPEMCRKYPWLSVQLKKLNFIYVETDKMKSLLEEQGFENIRVMPNCKNLPNILSEEINTSASIPLKLCTFSRVMKEKGIEDAVEVITRINAEKSKTVLTLDVYGQVEPTQTDWFNKLKNQFGDCIRYCGTVPFYESNSVLKQYSALLFPTKFYTEGIPGTIIDAYAAGLPVIASRWLSYDDVIEEKKTGLSYKFNDKDELYLLLLKIVDKPEMIIELKENCLNKSKEFLPENTIQVLIKELK